MKAAKIRDALEPMTSAEERPHSVRTTLRLCQQPAEPPPATPVGKRLLGSSPALLECAELVERAAKTMANTLIGGETGSGKEVAARAIHEAGLRADGPFVAVNCAALPDQLLESELFGYEKGAFTGATGRKPGRVELAESATAVGAGAGHGQHRLAAAAEHPHRALAHP